MNKEDKILETLVSLVEDVGSLKDDVGSLKGDVSSLKGQVNAVIHKLNEHDTRFDHIDGRFNRIETAVLETNKKLSENIAVTSDNNKRLTKIEKNLDILAANHESRIRRLEKPHINNH
jgi:chromosome segregation ATPase